MTVAIRSQPHDDPLARKARRRRRIMLILALLALLGITGGIAWAVRWSSWVRVNTINVHGTRSLTPDQITATIRDTLGTPSILLADTSALTNRLTEQFPVLERVQVKKIYPHTLEVTLTERTALGVWCRAGNDSCQWWDRFGARWGSVPRSRGPLLLLVDDRRKDTSVALKLREALVTLSTTLSKTGLTTHGVTLPETMPGDLMVHTDRGIDLYMDAFGDVPDQLRVLATLLASKTTDDPNFHPAYLDLRTPSRVYYK